MPSTIMQQRFGETDYPITRLVLERARTLRLTRTDLVRRLGYKDLNSGHRALTELLMTGTSPPTIAPRLADAVEVEADPLDQVSMATARQQHDEARAQILERERAYKAAFRPYLQIQTERKIPSPIFLAALLGTETLRLIFLADETLTADDAARDGVINRLVIEHYRDHAGEVPAFGAIIGYILVLLSGYDGVDFGLPFDVRGNRAGPMRVVPRLPEAMLGRRRPDRRLNGLLRLSHSVQHE